MSALDDYLCDYFELRRQFGFKLVSEEACAKQFVAFLHTRGVDRITVADAIEWVASPRGAAPIWLRHRMRSIRLFAEYAHSVDPHNETIPMELFNFRAQRPTPFIFEPDQIAAILAAARKAQPVMRGATYEALFGLLATTGMRVGEATSLPDSGMDLEAGVVMIRDAKFRRDRIVPLHPSAVEQLARYRDTRRRLAHHAVVDRFFLNQNSGPIVYETARHLFAAINETLGLRDGAIRPTIHDLRHTFAVRTLVEWHRAGINIDANMSKLADYLGHANTTGTYWYLSAVPELMALAAQRLEANENTGRTDRGRP